MTEGTRSYFDYRLRLQVPPNSPDRLLLEYIKHDQHLTYSEKEMVLAALRMCWLPIAFQHSAAQHNAAQVNGLTHQELKRIGLDAILRLKEQIRYVAAITGVDQMHEFAVSYEDNRSTPPSNINSPPAAPAMPEDGYEQDLFD